MALLETIAEILDWLARKYGRDLLGVAVQALRRFWSVLFRGRNILILGPRATGKTSLLWYLQKGKPFDVVNGEVRLPDPTGAVVLVGEKVSLDESTRAKIKKEVGGDPEFRHQWKQLLDEVNPEGIIYMFDGRLEDKAMERAIQELFSDVLASYLHGLRGLIALHMFVNFSDIWLTSPLVERRQIAAVMNLFETSRQLQPALALLRVGVHPTSLSANQSSWPEVKRALQHFAADL